MLMNTRWSSWWFLRGGNIHPCWKRRRYTQIRNYAMALPKEAWDEQQKVIDRMVLVLKRVEKHHQGDHSKIGELIRVTIKSAES